MEPFPHRGSRPGEPCDGQAERPIEESREYKLSSSSLDRPGQNGVEAPGRPEQRRDGGRQDLGEERRPGLADHEHGQHAWQEPDPRDEVGERVDLPREERQGHHVPGPEDHPECDGDHRRDHDVDRAPTGRLAHLRHDAPSFLLAISMTRSDPARSETDAGSSSTTLDRPRERPITSVPSLSP